jgi:mannitol 2-dehydrogenase
MLQALTPENLSRLPSTVARPAYDRARLRAGILHIGVGNFHRAHQAVYLDDLFNRGRDLDWAILGAGVRAGDAATRRTLGEQGWLSTVVETEPGVQAARVTGADDGLRARRRGRPRDRGRSRRSSLEDRVPDRHGGRLLPRSATGAFNPDHPEIRHDALHPQAPKGVFGILVAALKRRRERGEMPFTVMSCDNILGNGHRRWTRSPGLAR